MFPSGAEAVRGGGAGGGGEAGVPVRAGPRPGAAAGAAVPRGGGAVRVELGPAPVQTAVRGRAEVVLRRRAAPAVERGEESRPGAGLVGGELQVLLPGGVPEPGAGL